MKKDKIIEYLLVVILCCVLFFNLFVLNVFNNRYIFAVFLLVYWIICSKLVKGRKISNQNKKNVILLIAVLAIIYVLLLFIIGIFIGFYSNSIAFSIKNLYSRIIPITAIIVLSELIRTNFLTRNNKKSTVLITLALVLIDICIDIQLYTRFNLEDILSLVGYVGLSSISTNLLCNYMVKRYGNIPCIVYRIITTVYMYLFPILPDIYAFFETVYRIIYPYIIYIIIDFTFSKNNFKFALKDKKTNIVGLIMGIICTLGIVMLVSCKFKYGIMVVGSSSMSGSIEKGDAIIFEQYKNQDLKEDDIIIFNKEGTVTIHRIDDKQILNNETIFYTKGDNNQQRDEGYITSSNIKGIVKCKILYIGWPTILLNEFFTKDA